MDLDDPRCEALAREAAAGDARAARELGGVLWPHWLRVARANRALRASGNIDDGARDVAVELLETLAQPASPKLLAYLRWQADNPGRGFSDWIRIVTANAARDHARGLRARGGAGTPSAARLANELSLTLSASEASVRPAYTDARTAAELLGFAQGKIPEAQLAVLLRWLGGASSAEIATELSLAGAEEATRLLRAAVATLRRAFVDRAGDDAER